MSYQQVYNGWATSSTNNTLTDTTKSWETDAFVNAYVVIINGTNNGEQKKIIGNTNNTLTVDSNWTTNPNTSSQYVIIQSTSLNVIPNLISGIATGGGSNTLTDTTKWFPNNKLAGFVVYILAGTGANQFNQVLSNTANVLTMTSAWNVQPDNTSQYVIFPIQQFLPPNLTGDGAGLNQGSITVAPWLYNGATFDRARNVVSTRQVGSANTQLQFTIQTFNIEALAIIVQASGGAGVFASQLMTVEVSQDNTNFIQVEGTGLNLGTGASFGKQYDITHLAAGLAVNPVEYTYIRLTIPALGSGISAIATCSG